VDAFWEDPERVEEFARKPPDHRLAGLLEREAAGGLRVLDLGCAGGRNTLLLLERGADVTATDGAEAMVARTRDRVAALVGREEAARRVRRSRMDALGWAPEASFDLVVALGIYHNARSGQEWHAALAETARVLRAGGRLLVSVFTPETDLDGRGYRPVPGQAHLFELADGRRLFLVDPVTLDREMASHGLAPVEPTVRAEGKVEVGRRVSANGFFRKRP
jgi:SAM-dependent methyltransferase